MKEYIECKNCDSPNCNGCNIHTLAEMLHSGKFNSIMNDKHSINPTADVVEVVRCKDCACFIERTEEDDNDFPFGYGYCSHKIAVFGYLPPDHFCSYGEIKDGV